MKLQLFVRALVVSSFVGLMGQVQGQKLELNAGENLNPGEGVYSKSGNFVLIMENSDPSGRYGQLATFSTQNFSLDRNSVMSSDPTTALGSVTGMPQKLSMQTDGNLALYDARSHQHVWDSKTNGKGGVKLVVEDDGSVSVLNAKGARVWHSSGETASSAASVVAMQTSPAPVAPTPAKGETLPAASSLSLSEETILQKILAKKAEYPHDMPWDNSHFIKVNKNGGEYAGHGCVGFAMILSNAAFGENAVYHKFTDFDKIRIGDMVRMNEDQHSVVVIGRDAEKFTLAEGNMGGKIHWGREISVAEFKKNFNYAETRQP